MLKQEAGQIVRGSRAPLHVMQKSPLQGQGLCMSRRLQRSALRVRVAAHQKTQRQGGLSRSTLYKQHQEQEWESEFAPGSSQAKPPPLEHKMGRQGPTSTALSRTSQMIESSDLPAPVAALANVAHQLLGKHWEALPSRYKLVVTSAMAFVLCNMDKVNISVAIIPMAQDFGWSPTTSGFVQSSFFFGYMLSQIPGGYVVSRAGGRRILPVGVGLWSAATAAVPVLAGSMPGLFASRAAVGLGEGVAPSSASDMVARVIPNEERSRAMSFIFGGLHVGSLLGLLVAPALIERFGWQTVFYAFGGLGVAWAVWFEHVQGRILETDPETAAKLEGVARQPDNTVAEGSNEVPWRAFLRNTPVRALAYTHFCNNWFHYTMMAWLPTYFSDTLSLDLTQAAQLSLLPPVAAIVASSVAGTGGDALISRNVPVAVVRKLAQCTAFLLPTLCLAGATWTEDSTLTVGLITAALGLASFSLAGLYCNHADLSPRYAPVLLGLTNTSGAIPGIVGVVISGAILDQTGSWELALFAPSAFLFVTGAAVFTIWGSSEQQDLSNNAPFGFEKHLQPVYSTLGQFKHVPAQVQAAVRPLQQSGTRAFTKLRKLLSGNKNN